MSGNRVERRLAAILAADVVGYSRLMGEDEEGTLAALKTLQRELFDPKVKEHCGRLVKTTGDGALVEFASVVDAVRCAAEMQHAMAERNAEIPAERRIDFRIGINLGDIIIDEDDIYGDGVNVAARLEALAEPGGICVSRVVRDQVRDKLDVSFEDLGEQQVKNIARPVRVYRVPIGGTAMAPPASPAAAVPDRPSIAVLPFQNMSADPEQEYFADGMVEDIITGLSRIRWLFVIARNSSFTYRAQAVDVKRVGRELGVRYVLGGSVRKFGKRVCITAQLVEAETGVHVWAERYDRSLDDIFALQDEITLSTVAGIEPSLRAAEIERIKRKRPENLDAYDLLLRALPHVNAAMPEEARIAVPLLERALALEPDYGLAHGYLAWCFEVLFVRGGLDPTMAAAAVRHAHAAITHGRDDATALGLAGFVISLVEHDRLTAIEAFEAALALSQSCSIALILGCVSMGWANEAKRALEWGERAVRLSPFDPLIYAAHMGLAVGHFAKDRYEEAVNAARRAIQSNPGFSGGHWVLAAALAALGRIPEAKVATAQVLAFVPNFTTARTCASIGVSTALASPFTKACYAAGLP
jgi:adenylate cyclase